MLNTLLWIALGVAVINWISVEKKWAIGEYISKPLVIVFLLGWLWQNGLPGKELAWFGLGLLFSLAGDSLLLFPGDKFFISGLVAFLFAQVAYIIGFNTTLPQANPGVILLSLCLLAIAGAIFWKLNQGLVSHKAESMRFPVAFYTLVITTMAVSALLNLARPGWSWQLATITAVGGVFFVFSDSLLAWNKFVKPTPHAALIGMITYHLGQIGIVLGAVLYWL